MSRIEPSVLGDWWKSIDSYTFSLVFLLSVSGLVFLMAGSPTVAFRLNLSTFHFVRNQIIYMLPAFSAIFIISFFPLRWVRRLALIVYIGSFALILLTFHFDARNGAHRWVDIAGTSIQPSEFIKPAFVILVSWALAERERHRDMPANTIAFLLLPVTIIPLILQPDIGQTALILVVWCSLFFVAGLAWIKVAVLICSGFFMAIAAYLLMPHFQSRIDRFLNADSGDNFQVETALKCFTEGDWLGVGLGEGAVKRYLPDGHTDFIFAVIGEEFGIIICLVVLCIFACIVLRGLYLARQNSNIFCRYGITGLITLFGLQASFNMMVNVNLAPAKGMTLPFISYGGSSLLSLGLTVGFILALTRRRLSIEML